MEYYEKEAQEDIVTKVIRIPVESLEARLAELEQEIVEREKLTK